MEAWFYLSPFGSDRHLSSVWLILSNCFLLIFLTNYGTYSKCGGISHHGQGDGVFNIEDSMMRGKYTQAIFFSVYFFIFNRKTKHEKLRLNFQPRFHADACKGKDESNHISPPHPSPCCFTWHPSSICFVHPKKTFFQIWRFLSLFHQIITISHCTTMFDARLSASYARLSCKHDSR